MTTGKLWCNARLCCRSGQRLRHPTAMLATSAAAAAACLIANNSTPAHPDWQLRLWPLPCRLPAWAVGTLSLQPGNQQLCGTIPAGASGAMNVSASPATPAVLQTCVPPALPNACSRDLDWDMAQLSAYRHAACMPHHWHGASQSASLERP